MINSNDIRIKWMAGLPWLTYDQLWVLAETESWRPATKARMWKFLVAAMKADLIESRWAPSGGGLVEWRVPSEKTVKL